MSVNSLIVGAIKPLYPIQQHTYSGSASTYVTFYEVNQRSNLNYDNMEQYTRYTMQVDVSSILPIDPIADEVRAALTAVGFTRTSEIAIFEQSSKTYRKSMTFQINVLSK
jgi:hypothetical protein